MIRCVVREKPLAVRWKIKDLAQLYFSARKFVSNTDILFFWRVYTNITDHTAYRNPKLIEAILKKAARIKRHDDKRYKRKQKES